MMNRGRYISSVELMIVIDGALVIDFLELPIRFGQAINDGIVISLI